MSRGNEVKFRLRARNAVGWGAYGAEAIWSKGRGCGQVTTVCATYPAKLRAQRVIEIAWALGAQDGGTHSFHLNSHLHHGAVDASGQHGKQHHQLQALPGDEMSLSSGDLCEALENGAYYQVYDGSALAFESLSLTTNFT